MVWTHRIRVAFEGTVWQSLAFVFCVLFGIAMIINNQLEGEAWWFWYATLMHGGAKLYADLHLPLQPLYALETDFWIRLVGIKVLAFESLSVIHVVVFCFGILLILRGSEWPDWQKAIVLAGAFFLCLGCTAYRFDDVHIVADSFIFYSLFLLLLVAKTKTRQRQLGLAGALGILSGLTITTRLNDGVALLVATGICLLFLARKNKLVCAGLFAVAAGVTVLVVVKLTGDTLRDWAINSILRAAGAKGGTGSILTAPYRILPNSVAALRGRRWLFEWVVAIMAASALVQHYWQHRFRYMVALQLGMAGLAYVLSSWLHRAELREGQLVYFVLLSLLLLNYLLLPVVMAHYLVSKIGDRKGGWDPREVLILLPLAALASASASTGATVVDGFLFSQIALLLLLVPVIQPFGRQGSWANAFVITMMTLTGIGVMADRIQTPYHWLHFTSSPMFRNRVWYQHPVYGPMYVEKDQLKLVLSICREVEVGNSKPELLSMPWAYPNYFCNIPPWHGYVQTFFDTTPKATVDHLMNELNTAPPQWIEYERQSDDLTQHERILNGGHPLPHRYLDNLIRQKIATGQWKVVEKSDYLFPQDKNGDGWFLIRTSGAPPD
ncbi:MAG TPA: hypothetical protein VJU82_10270 [Acidobacteriaceae bacterium]|nr:hypothetical protein [Acidobacteriaceae bacterium]